MPKPSRPSWDQYFLEMALLAAKRSTCMRRQVGAIIVRDKNILATGYNGAPSGTAHCEEIGCCLREQQAVPSGQRHEICRAAHAEQNAICQAAKHGVSIDRATMYCTTMPCVICAKMMINTGVNTIYYLEGYADPLSLSLLEESGVAITQLQLLGKE